MAAAGNRETPSRIKTFFDPLFDPLKDSSKRVRTKISNVFRFRSRQNESTNEADCTCGKLCVHKASTRTRNGTSGPQVPAVADPQQVAVRVFSFPIATSLRSLSSSGRAPSDSIASTAIINPESSQSGSWPYGSTGFNWVYDIRVRRPRGSPRDAIKVYALLDTGCDGPCLMASSHFDRLNKDGRITLEEPFSHESEGLHGGRKKAKGIARALEWQFKEGGKTFKSDFLIVDMDQHDVVISERTLWKEKLLRAGRELVECHENSKRQQEDDDRALTHRMAAD
ncbi:retropepsin-like aspartic protease [Aspergillus stella-maris]|uniref:retropepsin-like aspartic protease n=1 Tax=Aspergillus stella-maris TaxID=1810926 RepID=UPI003CCCB40E